MIRLLLLIFLPLLPIIPQAHPQTVADSTAIVTATEKRYGTKTPTSQRQKDIAILDVFEGAASVKIVAPDWVDYLHLAKQNGQ